MATSPDDSTSAHVTGTVVHTVFANDEGWSVVKLRSSQGPRFTAVGPLLGVRDGDELRLTGRWVRHPRFGEQLEVASWVQILPTTAAGIRGFLASGRIKGLGPKTAARVVETFGLQTLEVLETAPERLLEVHGIGPRTVDKVRSSWAEHRGVQHLMVFLTGHGIAPGIAVRAFRRYGATALDVIRDNPYRLAEDVRGVGFTTADRMARKLGVAFDAPERLEAGLRHVLDQARLQGHVYLPRDELLTRGSEVLECPEKASLERALSGLEQRQLVVCRTLDDSRGTAVLPASLDRAESTVARRILELIGHQATPLAPDPRQAIERFARRALLELAGEQRDALVAALTSPVVVVTGGPGTGKTTLVRGLVEILGGSGHDINLAAPTGRAAKRLTEATGMAARTIHRLLEYNPALHEFQRGRMNPLEADMLVLDEVSMLDIELAAAVVEAVPTGCHLVLVGDADQLPSVGPGSVLADLIACQRVPVVRLERIFRQVGRSLIVDNAHRINHGKMPVAASGEALADFYFVARDDPQEAARLAVDFAARRVPQRFDLDPVEDIQLLSPMHRGELGVTQLNQKLQEVLNPTGPELTAGARSYRLGDKVMQVRNNYELDVFNGDIGRIVDLDPEEREIDVVFDGRTIRLDADDLEDLVPAYACTIHKSQGSEYPAVVVVLHHQHHVMLQRNLLYTAVTRGRRLVVVVGSRRALARAVRTATGSGRYTLLADRLRLSGAPLRHP